MQTEQTTNETRVPDIMNHKQAAAYINISVQQLATMVKNNEIKTHVFDNGTAQHEVYYRVELEEAKKAYAQQLRDRQDNYGKGLAIYNLSKRSREDIEVIREDQGHIKADVSRLATAQQGVTAQLTDLRARVDDLRSTTQQLRLGIDKLNAALGNK